MSTIRINRLEGIDATNLLLGLQGINIPNNSVVRRPENPPEGTIYVNDNVPSLEVYLNGTWHYVCTLRSVVEPVEIGNESYQVVFPNDYVIVTGNVDLLPPDLTVYNISYPNAPVVLHILVEQANNGNHTVTFDGVEVDVDTAEGDVTLLTFYRADASANSSWLIR